MSTKRAPYQSPRTAMERHILELVAHLRDGIDSRSGFANAVEAAQDHAFWLETRCREMSAEIAELEHAMTPMMPSLVMGSKTIDTRNPSEVYPVMGGAIAFDWQMERIAYRVLWRDTDLSDEKIARRIRRRAYREILARFRKEFEKTWAFNFARRQHERKWAGR